MKQRLDLLLVQRGLCATRSRAQDEIRKGSVYVDGKAAGKAGQLCEEEAVLELRDPLEYVSRGGLKLEKAMAEFAVSAEGKLCIDCGASSGGFTHCLLRGGARRVYAVDVGFGQLAQELREDPRVVNMERTNVRYLTPDDLPERPSLAVIDVSFISLRLILPAVRELLTEEGEILCLIKPQFEAGREKLGKKGVIRDRAVHKAVLDDFLDYTAAFGLGLKGLSWSPIRGQEGNLEFLACLVKGGGAAGQSGIRALPDTAAIVAAAHKEMY